MSEMYLREWAQKKKIWNKNAWIEFLNEYIEPLYVDLWNINQIHKFLSKLDGKNLGDLDDDLKLKVKTALYGGIGEGKDPNKSFARFMFENFGIKVSGTTTFEESVESFRIQMETSEDVKIEVESFKSEWKELFNDVENLIKIMIKNMGVSKTQLKMIEVEGNPRNLEWEIGIEPKREYKQNPEKLLPLKGESADNIAELVLKKLKEHICRLAVGKNPYTTFIYYIRFVKADYLKHFLNCETYMLAKLVKFLGLNAHDLFNFYDHVEIEKNTNLIRILLIYEEVDSTIVSTITNINKSIEKIYNECQVIRIRMIKNNLKTQSIELTPWKGFYREIFLNMRKTFKELGRCDEPYDLKFNINNSKKVESIEICYYDTIKPKIKLSVVKLIDDLTKISYLGLINNMDGYYIKFIKNNEILLKFFNKVIAGGGKT